jgi:hypothetical protein
VCRGGTSAEGDLAELTPHNTKRDACLSERSLRGWEMKSGGLEKESTSIEETT